VSGFGWKTIGTGYRTACAVAQSNGLTYCWGEMPSATLSSPSRAPVALPGNFPVTSLAVGLQRVCGLSAAGEIYCSGAVVSNNAVPPLVDPYHVVVPGRTFVQISASSWHLCALSTTGEVWCWGRNFFGELGVPPNAAQLEVAPVLVQTRSGERFTSISAGTYFTCGVSTASFAYCWGNNESGELGVGDHVSTWQPTPVAVASTASGVFARTYVACALIQTPLATVCWGSNYDGALGIASSIEELDAPATAVALPQQPGALAMGDYGTCVAGAPGSPTRPVDPLIRPPEAYCWGYNSDGENGNGTKTTSSWPVAVLRGNGFATISRGHDFACALTRIGVQYCWGDRDVGQVGVAVDTAVSVPQRVAAP
jgi:alpha-tubulin suppressor-like RCC1 family protein